MGSMMPLPNLEAARAGLEHAGRSLVVDLVAHRRFDAVIGSAEQLRLRIFPPRSVSSMMVRSSDDKPGLPRFCPQYGLHFMSEVRAREAIRWIDEVGDTPGRPAYPVFGGRLMQVTRMDMDQPPSAFALAEQCDRRQSHSICR
jgi:hypothetical protein